jgi:hypothetical protein
MITYGPRSLTGWLQLKNQMDEGKLRSLRRELSEVDEEEREEEEREKENEKESRQKKRPRHE